jgi:hypothetical protein
MYEKLLDLALKNQYKNATCQMYYLEKSSSLT